ncbi:hypothetical protein TGAM01_v209770 [Trichoderma gamsii]|uniref:Uncharacterized protein n=1 Tax=Trichoderma gamsii TaxID=398673 RepID=A0A2P4ZAJ0_9HYPO|nr:hypothetical protein TGAM01_v209770 [Trichoderma gamsii]PON21319.1 hypothetical protein TGAM01_v209770 [Trichoderma gamsii]
MPPLPEFFEWEAAENVGQIPRPMRIENPNFNAAVGRFLALGLQTQQRSKVDHASNAEANNDAATATLRLHHRDDKLPASLLQVIVSRDGLDLVGNIVMFEKASEDSACAESVRLEGHEDQYRRRERMASVLQMRVELRYQGTRQIHGSDWRFCMSISTPNGSNLSRMMD